MELREGYKNTEVGVIPEDWEAVELSEAVDFLDGQRRPIKSNERKSGVYPYYGASGIIDYVNDYIFDDELILLGEDGENILSRNLPLAFKVKGKIWVNNHAHVLKPKEDFNISFLTDFLESLDYTLLNTGTAQPKLNKQACSKIKVVKPSKTEQTAIATALSDADALINSLEKLIAKKRNIKQGAMQQLLKPKEGWEVKKLGDFLDYEQPTEYLVTDTEYNDNNQIPVLTAGKTFILGYTNEEHGIFKNLPVIIFDDFTTAIKYVDFPFKAKSSAMKMLLPKNEKVNLRFIYEIMLQIKYQVADHKRHWIGEYSKIEIKVPSTSEEQNGIATILSDLDADIQALETKLEKYRKIKLGMMQNLLTGKIRLV